MAIFSRDLGVIACRKLTPGNRQQEAPTMQDIAGALISSRGDWI